MVTVAVQAAAGTVAVASALPAVGPYSLEIPIGVIVLIAYGNLRGIREASRGQTAVIEGLVRSVQVLPMANSQVLECEVYDGTGGIKVLFHGRTAIRGIDPGRPIRVSGRIGSRAGVLSMANPCYDLLPRAEEIYPDADPD